MNPLHEGKQHFGEGRIALLQYVCLAVFVYLLSGFWQLQVQRRDVFAEQAERNRIKSLPLLAPRGRILDSDGRVLADNNSSFSVILSRSSHDPARLPLIADGLNLPEAEVRSRLRRFRDAPNYEALVLKQGLT